MKYVALVLMAVFGGIGLIMLIASAQGNATPRIVVGVLCLLAAAALGYLATVRQVTHQHVHHTKLELSGDVSLENLQCRQCGAEVGSESVTVSAGAVFVKCAYCGAQYQIEEQAKW